MKRQLVAITVVLMLTVSLVPVTALAENTATGDEYVFFDDFDNEPADVGVPNSWIYVKGNPSTVRVSTNRSRSGAQSFYVETDSDTTRYVPDNQPYDNNNGNLTISYYVADAGSGFGAYWQAWDGSGGDYIRFLHDTDGDLTAQFVGSDGNSDVLIATGLNQQWVDVNMTSINDRTGTFTIEWNSPTDSGSKQVELPDAWEGGVSEFKWYMGQYGRFYLDSVHISNYEITLDEEESTFRLMAPEIMQHNETRDFTVFVNGSEYTGSGYDLVVTSSNTSILTVDQAARTLTSGDETAFVNVTAKATIDGTGFQDTERVAVTTTTLEDATYLPASWAILVIVTDMGMIAFLVGIVLSAGICRASKGHDLVCIGVSVIWTIGAWAFLEAVPLYVAVMALLGLGLILFGED